MSVVVLVLALTGCSQGLDSPDVDELAAVAHSSFTYPVVEYGDLFEPKLRSLVHRGDRFLAQLRFEDALDYFLRARRYIEKHDSHDSLLLLPVFDRIVLAESRLGNIGQADKTQHRYYELIRRHFSDNEKLLIRAEFRLGCWHFLTKDWHAAGFDFGDVIRKLETKADRTDREAQLLEMSREFQTVADLNCIAPD